MNEFLKLIDYAFTLNKFVHTNLQIVGHTIMGVCARHAWGAKLEAKLKGYVMCWGVEIEKTTLLTDRCLI